MDFLLEEETAVVTAVLLVVMTAAAAFSQVECQMKRGRGREGRCRLYESTQEEEREGERKG